MNSRNRQAWIMAGGVFLSLFFLWGGGAGTSPLFLLALLKAFGWSHSRASWMPSAILLAVGISGPVAGWLLDRYEARIVMGTGAALAALGLIAASRATGFAELLLANLILGGGIGASGSWLPASVVIANWFGERRGMALGLAMAGMDFGAMPIAFVTAHIISRYGWRTAYLVLSMPVLILVLPFLTIFVRTRPKGTVKQKVTALAESLDGYEVGEAVKTRAFWMLVVAQVAWGLSATAVAIHLVAYLTGIGYTLRFATLAYGVLAGMAALGKPTMGVLADRIGGKNALGMALILIAGSNMLILGAGHEWLLVLYLLVGGISIAAPGALVPLVLANMCGLRRFGTLYGWIQGCVTLGLFGGPLVAGRLYDLTHSYTMSFELASLIAVAGAVAGFLCVAPRPVGLATLSQPQGSTA